MWLKLKQTRAGFPDRLTKVGSWIEATAEYSVVRFWRADASHTLGKIVLGCYLRSEANHLSNYERRLCAGRHRRRPLALGLGQPFLRLTPHDFDNVRTACFVDSVTGYTGQTFRIEKISSFLRGT